MQKYKSKAGPIQAIQLNFNTEGEVLFKYLKWGGEQSAKCGDWLASRDGEVYTIDKKSFAATYVSTDVFGWYVKNVQVWAEVAQTDGKIQTKEGFTDYVAGDYLVYNEDNRNDGYAISAEKFEKLYRPV